MATHTIDKFKYGSDIFVLQDSGALQLTGGNVTGPVNFGDSVTMDEATVGDLVVNGAASFTNNINVNTINGVNVEFATLMNYKGAKAATSNLPTSGNSQGDVWHINADGSEWGWNGSAWEELGKAIDLSGYQTKLTNPVTGTGTNGYLTKWTSSSTIGNGPALGSDTTKFLRNDGSWAVPPDNNTTYSAGTGLSLSGTAFSVKLGYTTSGNNRAVQADTNGNLYVTQKDDNTTYNFSGTTFYSGNSSTAEHNANNAVKNGNYYYTSNGPATSLGATTDDGALYVQSYSDSWVGQIAQDYRNGNLFVRGKNNGTWTSWVKLSTFSGSYSDLTNKPTIPTVPSNIVNTITTTAGAHTAITNKSGAVSFNVPTTAAHVGAATSDHAHGNITNGGDITATAPTIANGDQIIINDNSASKITNGPTFDGSTTTKALTPKGTWETFSQFSGSYNDLTNKPTIPTIPTNYVTTDTSQTVTGAKNFTADTFTVQADTIKLANKAAGAAAAGTNPYITSIAIGDGTREVTLDEYKDRHLSIHAASILLYPVQNAIAAFSTSSTYAVGAIVWYSTAYYRCKTAVTTAGAWNSSNWEAIAGTTGSVYSHGDILPTVTGTYSLGSSSLKWNNVYANKLNNIDIPSLTAQTTQAVYPIKINANGMITGYGSAVTIPTIPSNNVTGSGTDGYLVKWTGTNTVGNGPQIGTGTTKFLREDGTWQTPAYTTNTDESVKQTATTTSASYAILLSYTADYTTRTEGARKTSTLTYNPSTKALFTAGSINGLTLTAANVGFTIAGGTTSKTLTVSESYSLGAACAKAVTDSTSASAISTGTSLPTERDIYYGLPTINNSHAYTSSTTIYAPTAGGTSGYYLKGAGTTTAPTWQAPSDSSSASAISTGTALATERDIYYGLPTINGAHNYTSNTNIYAPTTAGTAGQALISNGSGAPEWGTAGASIEIVRW